jgi:serine/threonine-protein kinase
MSDEAMPNRTGPPTDMLDHVDRICDRFEAAWEQEGGRPQVEDYLGELDPAYRPALLRDLLAAEIDARLRRGDCPHPAEYHERFPGDSVVVADAFTTMPNRPAATPPGDAARPDTGRDLLFGLIALQNGLIDQDQLVAAFGAWAREKARPLADHLVARGNLDAEARAAVDALVGLHLKKQGGDRERSLAAIPAGRSTREGLARIGDPEIEGTLAHVGSGSRPTERGDAGADTDRTANYVVGSATSDGQRFRVLRPHAKGGLGAVFVALDTELHREVALKQILDSHADDPVSRHRFVVEAEVTGGLEHPGIVPVYGLGSYDDGRPYYAMRFIRGDSLKEAIDRFHGDAELKNDAGRRSLALRELLRRFTDLCDAIGYAHSRGVLHRDIKPGNVIVGKHGETLVVDWGLARSMGRVEPDTQAGERTLVPSSASGSAETLPGSALGTPAYMSPEQAQGHLDRLGPWSDVYSLGATLYCVLTGEPPFEGEVADVLRAVGRGDFRPPRSRDPSIDRALDGVCRKAMALNPVDRYASPRALAEDVERWMADEPVTAWREPLARRMRRWGRRNRTAVTAAGVAVLVALIGTASVLAVQTRANVRLREANVELAIASARSTKANTDLQAANERERQRFELAIDAIRRYHTDVSEDFLLKQDQFKDLRDRLLRDAVAFYRKLESLLFGQADARSRRALGRAYEEVGELTAKIGSIPEALSVHGKALEVRRALAQEPSSDPATRADVGRSLIAIGLLLGKTGRHVEELALHEEARSLLAGLAGSGPGRDAILGEIARSYFWTGLSHFRTGKTHQAMTAYEQALAIETKVIAAHADWADDQRTLSWCYNDIGMLLHLAGKTSEALTAFEASRRIKQRMADDHAGVAEYRRDLAISHNNIGVLLRETGKLAEASVAHQAAIKILEALAAAYPAVAQLQSDLANSLDETGDVLRAGGRTAEARASYERAVTIFEGLVKANPTVTEDQSRLLQGQILQGLKGLGATQLAAGQAALAVATWRRAIETGERLRSSNGETLYYLAGCHALLGGVAGAPGSGLSVGEGQAELDRAIDTLRRAVAAGYRLAAFIRRDQDLGPLHLRPDFQALLLDLAFPADPFAH